MGILACYWFFLLAKSLLPSVKDSGEQILILVIKDQGEAIEGIIRYLLHRNQFHLEHNLRLICIDLGSADETLAILGSLQRRAKEIWSVCSLDEREVSIFIDNLRKKHQAVQVFYLIRQEDGRHLCAALSRKLV